VRQATSTGRLYAGSSARIFVRAARKRRFRGSGMLFVVGSPRSGTTFFARAVGRQHNVVDLGEVQPLKAAIPGLATLPLEEAAKQLRTIVERVRLLSLSFGLRAVEQTPETAFVLEAALRAYPGARAVHLIRDGRDVVCSLLERGWLNADADGTDDAGLPLGPYPSFWVEPERGDEFRRTSNARRAAWAWRSYVTAARRVDSPRVFELRYEELTAEPHAVAERLAGELSLDGAALAASLAGASDRSVGRWRTDLTPEQLADVEAEAGVLLAELGYGNAGAV
jgi:protein-tyrosine sulfotransferase